MNIIDICEKVLIKHRLGHIELNLTEDDNYVMYFDIVEQDIKINEKMVIVESSHFQMPLEDYAQIIFCHELGHYLDKEIETLQKSTKESIRLLQGNLISYNEILDVLKANSIKAEENAWRIAEELIDGSVMEGFEVVRNNSLTESREIAEIEKKISSLRIENIRDELDIKLKRRL